MITLSFHFFSIPSNVVVVVHSPSWATLRSQELLLGLIICVMSWAVKRLDCIENTCMAKAGSSTDCTKGSCHLGEVEVQEQEY